MIGLFIVPRSKSGKKKVSFGSFVQVVSNIFILKKKSIIYIGERRGKNNCTQPINFQTNQNFQIYKYAFGKRRVFFHFFDDEIT
jgi:hypothetical protein